LLGGFEFGDNGVGVVLGSDIEVEVDGVGPADVDVNVL
jgi:hypothetical protein